MTKINLSTLKGERRKKGRVSKPDPELLANVTTLEHGEAILYVEADLNSDAYKQEMTKATPAIKKSNPDSDPQAIFQNRWLSRYRQRAKAVWDTAGMPHDEFDFVILNDGRILIGRK
jgi:hypothetical protein